MSKETEKALLEFEKYLAEHNVEEKDLKKATKKFIEEYNEKIKSDKNYFNEKADDYFDMAMDSEDIQYSKRMLKKAIKERPDFIDAHLELARFEDYEDKRLEKLIDVLALAKQQMEDENMFTKKYIGAFWGIIETRPYIRVLRTIGDEYHEQGKYHKALSYFKEILYLNESDNTGARYKLLSIYAILEKEEEAKELYDLFSEESTPMLLYMCALYFKLDEMKKAKEYLKRLVKINPDTRKVFTYEFQEYLMESVMNSSNIPYYKHHSSEEILVFCSEAMELFSNMSFTNWIAKNI